jgi:catechol-2,3-dioxygenase
MKIVELELKTHLLDEMQDFYVNKLHFPLVDQTINTFTVLVGSSKLTFVHEDRDSQLYYHFAMNIPMNQIHDAKEWLLQQGCSLIKASSMEQIGIFAKDDIVFLESINTYFYIFL